MFAIVLGFEVKNQSFSPLQRRILEVIKTLNENRKQPGLITAPNGTQAWCNTGPTDGHAIMANLNAGCATNNMIATSPAQMQMALLELYDKGHVLSSEETWGGNPAVVAHRLSELGELQFKSWSARAGHWIKSVALNPSGLSRAFWTAVGILLTLGWTHRQLVIAAIRYIKKLAGL
jgi:hypothetical protein